MRLRNILSKKGISNLISIETGFRNIDTENTVLFEERSVADDGSGKEVMAGYTDNYLRAYAVYDENLLGQLTRVSITDLYQEGVWCEVI